MKKLLALILVVLCCFNLASCGLFFSNEPAPPLSLPSLEKVFAVIVSEGQDATNQESLSKEQIAQALQILNGAVPTKEQSVNDYPSSDQVYAINIIAEEQRITLFLFKAQSLFGLKTEWKVELPYYGIYQISTEDADKFIAWANE